MMSISPTAHWKGETQFRLAPVVSRHVYRRQPQGESAGRNLFQCDQRLAPSVHRVHTPTGRHQGVWHPLRRGGIPSRRPRDRHARRGQHRHEILRPHRPQAGAVDRAGRTIVYSVTSKDIQVSKTEVDVATSWKRRTVDFQEHPCEGVAGSLSKRFGVQFDVRNPKVYAIHSPERWSGNVWNASWNTHAHLGHALQVCAQRKPEPGETDNHHILTKKISAMKPNPP